MRTDQEYREVVERYPLIPQSTLYSLHSYVTEQVPTGGFLKAVLSNDLFGACAQADLQNRQALADLVMVIANNCPMGCHGSPEKVKAWLNQPKETQ